jgi:hypothetical protein
METCNALLMASCRQKSPVSMRFYLSVCLFPVLILGAPLCVAQETLNLAGMTSPVEVQFDGQPASLGTGFFFQVLGPADPKITGPQWRAIQSLFLITNRHVVQPENWEKLRTLTFFLRRAGASGGADWVPVPIGKQQLGGKLHQHPDPQVDVVAVDVLDLVRAKVTAQNSGILPWNAVSHEELPGVSKIKVSEGDDIIVVGYPRAFYDEYNKLPVLKRGILASPWGTKYRGQDAFLIDYKGFHGSSGSPVITQPTHLAYENGLPLYSTERQFLFLGIYSGEPFLRGPVTETDEEVRQEKVRVDMGLVWYPSTIEQAIQAPVFAPPSLMR